MPFNEFFKKSKALSKNNNNFESKVSTAFATLSPRKLLANNLDQKNEVQAKEIVKPPTPVNLPKRWSPLNKGMNGLSKIFQFLTLLCS